MGVKPSNNSVYADADVSMYSSTKRLCVYFKTIGTPVPFLKLKGMRPVSRLDRLMGNGRELGSWNLGTFVIAPEGKVCSPMQENISKCQKAT